MEDPRCDSWCSSLTRFKNFADDVFVGVCLIQDRRFIYANSGLIEITGRTVEELTEDGMLKRILHPDDAAATLEGMDTVQSGASKSFTFQNRWIKKGDLIAEVEGAFTSSSYEGRPAVICTVVDITERKRLERQRTDFLAMVTHDFKSPLASVMGYAELISSHEDLDADVKELAEYIRKGGRKLLGMVEDFVFHARLESGNLVPEFSPVKPGKLMEELVKEFAVQVSDRGQTIEVRCEENLPAFMLDRNLIERALSNLVQNAINYSGKGCRITLKAGLREGREGDLLVLSVSDAGPGIHPRQRLKLFDKYHRYAASSGVRGAGLGLTIVKTVAESHGGRVEIESEPGRGSTFVLLLPVIKS